MNAAHGAIFGALVVMGLAGSLHCIGMCGPVLIGLSRAIPGRRSLVRDAVAYHLGRLWTYALLGLLAGSFGRRLELAWGGRRGLALTLGLFVAAQGLLLLRKRRTALELRLAAWLSGTLHALTARIDRSGTRGFAARVLIGAIMGLTPCGMVWMALVPAAALGNAALAALGMLCFGLGTVPTLTGVVLLEKTLAPRLRRHGRAVAAIALILAGVTLLARSIPSPSAHEHTPASHSHHPAR